MTEPRGEMSVPEFEAWLDAHPPLPTHEFMEPCGRLEGADSCWYCGLPRAAVNHALPSSEARREP